MRRFPDSSAWAGRCWREHLEDSTGFFYRALARGNMGLIAPVAAVLSAAIPTIVDTFSQGVPGPRHVFGFCSCRYRGLANLAQRSGDGTSGRDWAWQCWRGSALPGFISASHQAGNASALWVATCSRWGSFLVTGALVLFGRHLRAVPTPVLGIAVVAGILDITGSVAFIRAAQIGRLDDAVVLSSLYPAITVLLARIFSA